MRIVNFSMVFPTVKIKEDRRTSLEITNRKELLCESTVNQCEEKLITAMWTTDDEVWTFRRALVAEKGIDKAEGQALDEEDC